MFRIGRILALKRSNKYFTSPLDFSLGDYMAGAWSIMCGPTQTIKIRFNGSAARLTVEAMWHPNQRKKDGDAVIATYKSGGLKEVCARLLRFGGEAELLEPPELRGMVAEMAKAALKRNKAL